MPAYRSKTIKQASFWLAAVLVGVIGVGFGEFISFLQEQYNRMMDIHPVWATALTPCLFLLATGVVVLVSPHARGSGIPQALKALMMSLGSHHSAMRSGLISIKTAIVKVISTSIGLIAGASVGREGPTVQISTAIFAAIGARTKKYLPHLDFHSYLVAGSAAGVAAAFNTPIAGISFALEEMAEGTFAQIKQTVMVSVIIAGIAAQTLVGNYLYFGNPSLPLPEISIVFPAMLIGLAGGLMGSLFAKSLTHPFFLGSLSIKWWQRAAVCGGLVAAINYLTDGQTAGSGYEITRSFMEAETVTDDRLLPVVFTVGKLITTILSYLSGMAGGIFSPSLAIGAGMGANIATLAGFSAIKTCALLGMVAFFTGAVQAPLTAVIIVMEMTDVHELILPLMIAAFVSQGISKLIMPTSLYRYLALHRSS